MLLRAERGRARGATAILLALLLPLLFGEPARGTEQHAVPDEGPPASARAVVESLHEVLLLCMKEGRRLGFQGRLERIANRLDETFDLAFMARLSIGSAWNDLALEERIDFIELSRRLSASNYAKNFKDHDGQRFETHSDAPAGRGTILVSTELIQPNDENVQFDYRLRQTKGGWRIIDVQLDGKVSEITLRRADYRSVIQQKGHAHLVRSLEERIEELAKE